MPIDFTLIDASLTKTSRLVVVEECASNGSVGQRVAAHAAGLCIPLKAVRLLDVGMGFVTHGSVNELRKLCGIDAAGIVRAVTEAVANG